MHLRDNNCQEKNIAKGKLRKNLLLILRTFPRESVQTSSIHYKSVLLNHPTVIVYCGDPGSTVGRIGPKYDFSLLYNNLRAEGEKFIQIVRKNLEPLPIYIPLH